MVEPTTKRPRYWGNHNYKSYEDFKMNESSYQEQLHKICDNVFLKELAGKASEPFYQKWLKSVHQDWANSIWYELRIKGVEISVKVYLKGERGVARLFVGNSQIDKNAYFSSKEITFSIWKRGSYLNEFLNRLGLSNLAQYVENVLEVRNKSKKAEEELAFKKAIFKRFLPFEDGYKGKGHLSLYGNTRISVEDIQWDSPTLTITGDVDFIMRICAYAGKLLNSNKKEYKKA